MDDLRAGGWTNLGGEFGFQTRSGVPTDAGNGNNLPRSVAHTERIWQDALTCLGETDRMQLQNCVCAFARTHRLHGACLA